MSTIQVQDEQGVRIIRFNLRINVTPSISICISSLQNT